MSKNDEKSTMEIVEELIANTDKTLNPADLSMDVLVAIDRMSCGLIKAHAAGVLTVELLTFFTMQIDQHIWAKEEDHEMYIPPVTRLLVPAHFSVREGGKWYKYYGKGYTLVELESAIQGRKGFTDRHTLINNTCRLVAQTHSGAQNVVHALLFNNPFTPDHIPNEFRWDEYSGWTTEIPPEDTST